MKKCKKWLALLLAVALTLSVSVGPASVAVAAEVEEAAEIVSAAEEPAEEEAEEEPAEEEEAEPEEEAAEDAEDAEEAEAEAAEEAAEEDAEAEEAEADEEAEAETEAESSAEAAEDEPAAADDTTDEAESDEDTSEELEVVFEDAEEETTEEDEADAEVSAQSLLPLEEKDVCLVLSGYSEDELAAMPVDTIVTSFLDSDGNSVPVSDSATTVWKYVMDDTDGVEVYERYTIGNNETIDMSTGESISTYTMELIIGSENQLDSDNIRYQVTVYVLSTITENIEYKLYTQDEDGYRTRIWPSQVETTVNTQTGLTIDMTVWTVIGHQENTEYYLGITSEADEHPYIKTDVYTYTEFMMLFYGYSASPITDQILNQNMWSKDAGYLGIYDTTTSAYDTKNMFFLVYTDTLTGSVIDYTCYAFIVTADETSYIEGNVYTYDSSEMTDVVCYSADEVVVGDVTVELTTGAVTVDGSVYGLYYMLEDGYSADDEYYCVLNAYGSTYGYDANSYVTKAVVGLYDSLEDAADAEDIKEELIPVDQDAVPRGYKANYNYENGGVYFTVFFEDGSVWQVNVRTIEYMAEYDMTYVQSYTSAPIVGEADPWFQVYGVKENGRYRSTYIVENGGTINMDTMYGYGYQTVFIKDASVDLSALQPLFWVADEDTVKVYVNGNRISSGDAIDCSSGTVEFSVVIDGNVRNYMVSFVKQTSGAELYVCGPETREVFLDEYFEYKHDILIANIGDEELTGLRVELDATNCKLDDYWTVGGDGNDTLAAFTSTDSDSEYGELSNLAKIRLLPDGEGEIEGTLTVYADGQDPIVINLTGRAQNPTIVTTGLDDAVKYVPYSYLVTTNNMYDWTDVTFTLVDGELPEGLDLYSSTGEIYGTPQETGEFTFTVEASFTSETYSFDSAEVELTLTVLDNTNDNVYNATDDGYDILTSVGEDTNGDHDYILTEYADEEFRSSGVLDEFIDLWLNGEKLVLGEDYTVESGSTKITILEQTLENKADASGTNTLAAEFRVDGDTSKTLKRTAQNFRLNISSDSDDDDDTTDTSSGSSTGNTGTTDTGNTGSTGSTGNTGTTGTGTSGATDNTANGNGDADDDDDADDGDDTTGTTGTTTTTNGATNGTAASTTVQTTTCIVSVTDADGNPVGGLQLELHSTPQTATTGSGGTATFGAVEFGSHTLYVKEDGVTKATRSFELVSGSAVSLSGDTITAVPGGTFTLNVQFDGETLTLLSVDGVSTPQTGDSAQVMVWLALLLASGLGLTAVQYKNRKRDAEG